MVIIFGKKAVTVLIVLLICAGGISAQISRDNIDDAFRELEDYELTLHFFNALNADPIPNATVEISGVGVFKSDLDGRVMFPIPPDMIYQVRFIHKDFISSDFTIEVAVGSLFFNRFSISPRLPVGSIRIVLDWGKNPVDLDAHFIKNGSYHISYHNMKVSSDGVSRLDRDDTSSFGPETITSNRIDQSNRYIYFIHDYTNKSKEGSLSLSKSQGNVKIFGNDQLLHSISVQPDISGRFWKVFEIINGEIVLINEVSEVNPAH